MKTASQRNPRKLTISANADGAIRNSHDFVEDARRIAKRILPSYQPALLRVLESLYKWPRRNRVASMTFWD
jgi:hypothetical protein